MYEGMFSDVVTYFSYMFRQHLSVPMLSYHFFNMKTEKKYSRSIVTIKTILLSTSFRKSFFAQRCTYKK